MTLVEGHVEPKRAEAPEILTTRCCIVGGGPAGMVLGYLLARAGVDVIVLEKHKDFLRDFRGDTVHPSTLEIMHELGLLNDFLKRPHQEVREIAGIIGGAKVTIADFTHLASHCRFVALVPQWDFLDFLSERAQRYPNFQLMMETEVTTLLTDRDRVTGVKAKTPAGELIVHAGLVVGADGRRSTVRDKAKLERHEYGVPIDVLWMRLSKRPEDSTTTFGHIGAGAIFVTLDRGDYWQCALVIPKGGAEALKAQGLEAIRSAIARVAPEYAERTAELDDWDKIKLLTVTVDRLRNWAKPGLLCIGDSAHAMSPIGGVGINLAVQDAVATANLLAKILRDRAPSLDELRKVQARRSFPTRATQSMQRAIQDRIMTRVLNLERAPKAPFLVKLLNWIPALRRIPARLIGIGFRPEHVRSPELPPPP